MPAVCARNRFIFFCRLRKRTTTERRCKPEPLIGRNRSSRRRWLVAAVTSRWRQTMTSRYALSLSYCQDPALQIDHTHPTDQRFYFIFANIINLATSIRPILPVQAMLWTVNGVSKSFQPEFQIPHSRFFLNFSKVIKLTTSMPKQTF